MQDNTQPQVPVVTDPTMAAPVVTTPAPQMPVETPVAAPIMPEAPMPVEEVKTDVKVELPEMPVVSSEAPVTTAPVL